MIGIDAGSLIGFHYVNWQGKESQRSVIVRQIYYGNTEYHKEDQWLLEAYDVDKKAIRVFAIRDMSDVKVYLLNKGG